MPVLIVSEKTWPHDGFSRKRSTRPSSSVTTIPNSSGFSTDLSPIVTAAPFSLWNATILPRSMSQSASPEMTRKVSSRRSDARRTEPAVPSGLSSTEYSMFNPRFSPSLKYERIACGRNATVTTTSVSPCVRRSSRMCSMHGLPTIGTIGFGWLDVSGLSLVPSPPAMTTARLERVLAEREQCERETGPEHPQRPAGAVVGDHHEPERRIEQPRRRLADHVHLELVAAADQERRSRDGEEVARRDHERRPRQPPGVDEEQHRRVDHQAVSERVRDLAERRLDAPPAREEAVDLVRDAGDPEDDRRRPRPAAVAGRDQRDVDGDQEDAEDRQRVRDLRPVHADRICRCRYPDSSTRTATASSGPSAAVATAPTSGRGAT